MKLGILGFILGTINRLSNACENSFPGGCAPSLLVDMAASSPTYPIIKRGAIQSTRIVAPDGTTRNMRQSH